MTFLSFFAAFYYVVPHHSVTATKLKTNFLRNDPVNKQYLRNDAKDIVIVMDGSASIGSVDFDKGKTALNNMIGSLREGRNDTKVAAVTFSSSARASSARVSFSFLPCQLAENKILNLPYPAGREDTYAARWAEPSSGKYSHHSLR